MLRSAWQSWTMFYWPRLFLLVSEYLLLTSQLAATFSCCTSRFVTILIYALSPNNHTQILQSDLHTFPLRISWENLIKDQGIFSLVIILLILITISLDNLWISLGENWCWSLLGFKGLALNIIRLLSALIYIPFWKLQWKLSYGHSS